MKEILFKKVMDPEQRMKNFSIKTTKEEKESKTEVEKAFSYHIVPVDHIESEIASPEIYVNKHIDNKKKTESFHLEVKGYFFMTKDRTVLKVNFHHSLHIKIQWTSKIFSPKKSEILTD